MFEEPYLTLSQLNRQIRGVVEEVFGDEVWVAAEVAEINVRGRRHCYLDLVEKDEDEVVARSRATLWSSRLFLLDEFESITGETLKAGMEVLLRVRVRYHEVWGLSLDIVSLNPIYTLGGMARKKRETIERLLREGMAEANKQLPFPLVPQRVAVITSPTAAGLGDFIVHLEGNGFGYLFSHALFPAAVQGADAEASLCAALREVRERADLFDLAVILRGGGSQVDLSCFDGYALAQEILRCPLPVITGIGHEKDDTVADMVAHTRAKTPTAAAELLIERTRCFEQRLLAARDYLASEAEGALDRSRTALALAAYRLSGAVGSCAAGHQRRVAAAERRAASAGRARLSGEALRLSAVGLALRGRPMQRLARADATLALAEQRLRLVSGLRLERAGARLETAERDIRNLDPANVLRRGYSITRRNGRALLDAAVVAPGDTLVTQLAAGTIESRVEGAEGSGEG